ncbi:MAG: ubiquinol-cytochrome C chaperone family protein [Sphingomicrobium sp.]
MLDFLFPRLTAQRADGAALFGALTGEARRPHWYVEGEVPDTLDGRFAVLATVTALALVRLEREDEAGNRLSVALTERFVEVLESEHRELGLGDPALGRTVRRLVSILARRTELWRSTSEANWAEATCESLYKGEVSAHALEHGGQALARLSRKLEDAALGELEQGKIG